MIRFTGFILLLIGLILIAANVIRFTTVTRVQAREPADQWRSIEPRVESMNELSSGLSMVIRYVVIPASLLLAGGVLLEHGRNHGRSHLLKTDVDRKE